MLFSGTLTLLRGGHVIDPTLQARQASSDHQRNQLPSGPPIRRSHVETQRTRWLSRVIPMAGSWSLAAHPKSYRPVTPSGKLPAISPHSFGRSTGRIRRLGDFARMIIKRQEESPRITFVLLGQLARLSARRPSGADADEDRLMPPASSTSAATSSK